MKSSHLKDMIPGLVSVAGFVFIWEGLALLKIADPLYVGTPHVIIVKLQEILSDPKLIKYFINSAQSFGLGYIAAIMIGSVIGLFLGIKKTFKKFIYPFVSIMNATPFVAVLPLIVIWFGLGVEAKAFLVFLMVVSPMIIYTHDSVQTMDKRLLIMADTFKVSGWKKLTNLYYYHSLPYILSGAKIGIGRGLIAVIIAEMYGLGRGIAYFVPYYGATYQTDKLLANIVVILMINFILLAGVKALRKKLVFWE